MENNEMVEKICALRGQFDELASKYSDDERFADSISALLEENEFAPQDKIREDYNKNAANDRLLKIGIVGAVKAGKSSLLNALFFNGKDVLPKAATPMTAALTELSYGETCEITVDFFTENDVQQLKAQSEMYEREIKRITDEERKKRKEAWLSGKKRRDPKFDGDPSAAEEEQFKKSAEDSAKLKVKQNIALAGAYEQYEKIRTSSVARKTESEVFTVDSIEAIAGKLEDYVGSDGKYMPFTSKVSIKLPIDALRDVCVIDTPGFNDPVPSRDDRARKSLRECDVVFILSPARQFISANDKDVMAKITTKNGIRELYLIPSQVDSQLFNMEILDEADGDMNAALNIIKETLGKVARNNLKDINGGGVFNELINETEKRMFPTSGICESMEKTIADKAGWDSGRKKVWENLTKNYPDYFSDSDIATSTNSLKLLGNIEPIDGAVKNVKVRKEEIFKEKLAAFDLKYRNAAKGTKEGILKYIEAKEADLENKDVKKLEREIAETQKMYSTIGPELKDAFIDCVMEWYNEVKADFENSLKKAKGEAKDGVDATKDSYTNSWTTGWWLWKEEHSENITTANVSEIKNAISEYIVYYNDNLPHFLQTEIYRLTKKVMQAVQKTWSENSTEGSDSLVELRNKVRSVIASLNFEYDLEYKGAGLETDSEQPRAGLFGFMRSSSSSGIVEGSEAEEWLSKARDCISSLNREFKKILHSAIDDVYEKCKACDFAKEVMDGYLKKLEKDKADLEKPKLALENFRRMREEVEKITC